MRNLRKNKKQLWYAIQTGTAEIPVIENGVIKTITVDGVSVQVGSGSKAATYSSPVSFMGNLSQSGGEVSAEEFGLSVSDYDAVLVLEKEQIPLKETSLIWTSEPKYKDLARTLLDDHSADYKVLSVKPSINGFKAVLGRLVK